jgi:gluconokinase
MPPSLLDSQLDTLERPGSDEPILALSSSAAPRELCEAAVAWLQRA